MHYTEYQVEGQAIPDVMAFSVLGWNYRLCGALSDFPCVFFAKTYLA